MLTPAHPHKDDPRYQEKMERFRKDLAHKKAYPESWGVVRHARPEPPGADETADANGKAHR